MHTVLDEAAAHELLPCFMDSSLLNCDVCDSIVRAAPSRPGTPHSVEISPVSPFITGSSRETRSFITGTQSHATPTKRILFSENTIGTCSASPSPLPKSLKVDPCFSSDGLSKSLLMRITDFVKNTSRLHEMCVACALYKSLFERHDKKNCGTLKSYGACFCCFRAP